MNPSEENNVEKPTDIFVQRDILGQDKSASPSSPTKAKPGRIFVVLAIVVVLVVAYWLVKH